LLRANRSCFVRIFGHLSLLWRAPYSWEHTVSCGSTFLGPYRACFSIFYYRSCFLYGTRPLYMFFMFYSISYFLYRTRQFYTTVSFWRAVEMDESN
jgi:hypothetical protein